MTQMAQMKSQGSVFYLRHLRVQVLNLFGEE